MTCVLGFDPGIKGAIALFDTDDIASIVVHRFPSVVTATSSGKKRRRLDIDRCWSMLAGVSSIYEPKLAVFEDVNGFAGNQNSTGASGFVFGRAAGVIEGMVAALQIPRHYVSASVWKKHYKLHGKGAELKTASRIAATQCFPQSSSAFSLVQDDGPAEAALLARYGALHVLGHAL